MPAHAVARHDPGFDQPSGDASDLSLEVSGRSAASTLSGRHVELGTSSAALRGRVYTSSRAWVLRRGSESRSTRAVRVLDPPWHVAQCRLRCRKSTVKGHDAAAGVGVVELRRQMVLERVTRLVLDVDLDVRPLAETGPDGIDLFVRDVRVVAAEVEQDRAREARRTR